MRKSETLGSRRESQGLVRGMITDYVVFTNLFENLVKAALSSQKDALLQLQGAQKPADESTGPTARKPDTPTGMTAVDAGEA